VRITRKQARKDEILRLLAARGEAAS